MSAKNFKNISFKFKIKTFKQKKELMSSIISPGKYQETLCKKQRQIPNSWVRAA